MTTAATCNSFICIFCYKSLEKPNERNLVEGRGIFKAVTEINDLPFVIVLSSSPYICKHCLNLLKKRNALRSKLRELDSDLEKQYLFVTESRRRPSNFEITSSAPPLKIRLVTFPNGGDADGDGSTFQQMRSGEEEATTSAERLSVDEPCKPSSSETKVSVEVAWPSQTRRRELGPALQSLGKMLLRGTFQQIASAAWKCKDLRPHLVAEVLKTLNDECTSLCTRKSPSLLRQTKRDDIVKFSFIDFNSELERKCPLFHAALKTACLKRSTTEKAETMEMKKKWLQPLCMAAAICAKTRSSHMTALQLIISIILQHCSLTVSTAGLMQHFCNNTMVSCVNSLILFSRN